MKYKNLKCVLFMAVLKSISRLEVAFCVFMFVVSVTHMHSYVSTLFVIRCDSCDSAPDNDDLRNFKITARK